MATILVELFNHNTWANLRLLDACQALSDGQLDASVPGTYGSIRDTLVHIAAAQERYAILLTKKENTRPLREDDAFPGLHELRERTRQSSDALTAVAARTRSTRILRGIRHGEPYAIPASVVLIQAINHATEHRAHVSTILTQQGITPPNLDGWNYGKDTTSH